VLQCVAVWCSVLQCVAVCCSVLQCVAVCCSVLQYVAVCCSVVQCAAVCCSVLQCVADCANIHTTHSNSHFFPFFKGVSGGRAILRIIVPALTTAFITQTSPLVEVCPSA